MGLIHVKIPLVHELSGFILTFPMHEITIEFSFVNLAIRKQLCPLSHHLAFEPFPLEYGTGSFDEGPLAFIEAILP